MQNVARLIAATPTPTTNHESRGDAMVFLLSKHARQAIPRRRCRRLYLTVAQIADPSIPEIDMPVRGSKTFFHEDQH